MPSQELPSTYLEPQPVSPCLAPFLGFLCGGEEKNLLIVSKKSLLVMRQYDTSLLVMRQYESIVCSLPKGCVSWLSLLSAKCFDVQVYGFVHWR